ncbi:MAG: HAD hydrolase-like protein [Candidatus Aenigmarchaeota archaeon]|nr:HAD hydrolase-like protein [Candidatus Aenigmarchaeota archaeon]
MTKNTRSKEDLTKNPKLVIFDFDGVLFDSLNTVWKIIKPFIKKHGFTKVKNKQDFRKLFITNFYTATEHLGFDICHTPELHNEIMNIMETNYDPPIFLGITKIIKKLAQRCTLAVESSNYESAMRRILKAHDLEKYFTFIAGADKEPSKTKRLQNLLQNVRPAAALFVTDTVGDISEAKKAGIPSIAVSWGYHTYRQLKKAHPLDTARTPEELVKKIKDYFG